MTAKMLRCHWCGEGSSVFGLYLVNTMDSRAKEKWGHVGCVPALKETVFWVVNGSAALGIIGWPRRFRTLKAALRDAKKDSRCRVLCVSQVEGL